MFESSQCSNHKAFTPSPEEMDSKSGRHVELFDLPDIYVQSVFPVFPASFMGTDYLVPWKKDNRILMVSDISRFTVQISALKLRNDDILEVLNTREISINMPFNGTSARAFRDEHQLHAVKVNSSAPIALLVRTTADDELNNDSFASYYMSFPPWICGKRFVTLPTRYSQWTISVRITGRIKIFVLAQFICYLHICEMSV